ncbi:MAG TPA: CHASE domain-containing protein [Ramlibacter sp.]|nr:CHASE domain-containing protein [Ramlibacter sp.]
MLLAALVLTGVATWLALGVRQAREQAAVEASIQEQLGRLQARMDAYLALLRATRSYVVAQGEGLGREGFRLFVAGLNIAGDYGGIQGIGWSPRVEPAALEAFEAAARGEGHAGFTVHPPGPREPLFSILYLEPLNARNQAALGFDMSSEPVRAEAMARARDGGRYATSGGVILRQEIDPQKRAGFLVYTPVYEGSGVPATVEERRGRLRGYVYAPFRAPDFFGGVFDADARARLQALRVGMAVDADARLLFGAEPAAATPVLERRLTFGGQDWTLLFEPRPRLGLVDRVVPYAVAGAGTAIALLLFLLARAQAQVRRRLEALAQEERKEREFAELFVGVVSHDLRNPLNVILLNASLLERDGLAPAQVARCVERIQSSSQLSLRLIRDLLDFTQARLGSGIPINRTAVDLAEVVGDAVEELRHSHPQREIRLEVQGHGRGDWDPDRVTQVVANLVSNALVHGGPQSPVTVRVLGEGDPVRLQVHNAGHPIPAELLPELFEPLRQGVPGEGSSSRNIGLGLFIVRQIALAHDGRVACESSAEAGTTFTVELPRACATGSTS